MLHNRFNNSVYVFSFLVLLGGLIPKLSLATDDPCIQALAVSNPGQAAALSAIRDGHAKPKSFDDADKASEGDRGRKDNDPQLMRRWVADAEQTAGDWNTQAAPFFAAAASTEMNPAIKIKLTICAGRRTGQGKADELAAAENRRNADKLVQEDRKNGDSYDPRVLRIEQAGVVAAGAN